MNSEESTNNSTKRLKNAYLAMPVAGLEVEKGNIFGPLLKGHEIDAADIDTQFLAIRLIDFLAERLAVGQGASRDEIVERLAENMKFMCPKASDELCEAVSSRVLDRLANGPEGYKAFSFSFFDETLGETKRYSFRLIEYWQPNIGKAHVYRATPEAVTLFLSMFTIEPILEHAAQNFLIKHLLEMGHISGAVEVARRASGISMATQAELQSCIQDLKRNPRKKGWVDDVLQRLKTAREHIQARYEEENALLTTIGEMLGAEADPTQQQADLVQLKGIVEKCYKDHLALGSIIHDLTRHYHKYHSYAFITPVLSIRISPEEQILPRVMDMPLQDALNMADGIGCFFLGPNEPKVLDLLELFAVLEEAQYREMKESQKKQPDVITVDIAELNNFDAKREQRLRELILKYINEEKASSASEIFSQMDEDDEDFEQEDYVAALHVLRSIFRRESDLGLEGSLNGFFEHHFAVGRNLSVFSANTNEKGKNLCSKNGPQKTLQG